MLREYMAHGCGGNVRMADRHQCVKLALPAACMVTAGTRVRATSRHVMRHGAKCRPLAALAVEEVKATAGRGVLALREWSVVNAAIQDGLQTVLLRKGGIEEKGFRIEAQRFLLFPSYFHADTSLLKPGLAERYRQAMEMDPKAIPQLELTTYAEITGAWATPDPAVAAAVQDLHVGTAAFLENRLKWRKGQALTVLELRAWRLTRPVLVTPGPELFGCFSWVDLGHATDLCLEGMQPCMPESEFLRKQKQLREALAGLQSTRDLLLV